MSYYGSLYNYKWFFILAQTVNVIPQYDYELRQMKRNNNFATLSYCFIIICFPISAIACLWEVNFKVEISLNTLIITSIWCALVLFININFIHGSCNLKLEYSNYIDYLWKVDDLFKLGIVGTVKFKLKIAAGILLFTITYVVFLSLFWVFLFRVLNLITSGILCFNIVIFCYMTGLNASILEDRFKLAHHYLRMIKHNENLENCKKVFKVLYKLSETVDLFNQNFGWNLLLTISFCLINILGGINLLLFADDIKEIQENQMIFLSAIQCLVWFVSSILYI